MRHRSHQSHEDRRARSAVMRIINKRQPMLRASLVTMRRVCGKPGCKCVRGERHVSLYLAVRAGKERKMIYVPRDLEEKVRRWVCDGQEALRLLDVVSQASLKVFLKDKEKKAAARSSRRRRGPEK